MKPLGEWPMRLRLLCLTLLLLPVTGCGTEIPAIVEKPKAEPPALCTGSRAARAKLADTLANTPDAVIVTPWGEQVVTDGAALVDVIDAGCKA